MDDRSVLEQPKSQAVARSVLEVGRDETATASAVAGSFSRAWGLAPLATCVLLFVSLVVLPSDGSSSDEAWTTADAIAVVALLAIVGAYIWAAVLAFRGRRGGLSRTLTLTVVLSLFMLLAAAGTRADWALMMSVNCAVAALALHIAAVCFTRQKQQPTPSS